MVGEGDGDPPKKEQKCRIFYKKHPCGACAYKCRHCGNKGHRSDGCWQKFPEKATGVFFFLKDVERHVMTTISIKSLMLDGTQRNCVEAY